MTITHNNKSSTVMSNNCRALLIDGLETLWECESRKAGACKKNND